MSKKPMFPAMRISVEIDDDEIRMNKELNQIAALVVTKMELALLALTDFCRKYDFTPTHLLSHTTEIVPNRLSRRFHFFLGGKPEYPVKRKGK